MRVLADLQIKEDPNDAAAKRLLLEVKSFARDRYLRGYQLRDHDPREASRVFLEVTELTAPDDELHQKARSRLLELRAQVPDLAAAPPSLNPESPVGGRVTLRSGMDGHISVRGIQRVAVGDPEVVDVRVQGTEVLLTGRQVGKTTLLVWREDGQRESWLIDVRP